MFSSSGTVPLWGKASSVPALIVVARCIGIDSMFFGETLQLSPNALSTIAMPPEAGAREPGKHIHGDG
jgi:hypothetical protein